MIQHLKKKFPDVCKQVFDFEYVFSRREIENKVIQFSITFGQSVIAYTQRGKRLCIYTSRIFTDKLKSMRKDDTVVDSAIGRVGVIVSDKPFFCSCTLCIRVDFGDTSDVYDCAYFM